MPDLFQILSDKYPLRNPTQSETNFFKENNLVSGYAADDKSVVLNPFSSLKESEKRSVANNERIRLALKESGIEPEFEITDEQKDFFKGTSYANDPIALKSTIVARILSGDTSGKANPDQIKQSNLIKEKLSSILIPQVNSTNSLMNAEDSFDNFMDQERLLKEK